MSSLIKKRVPSLFPTTRVGSVDDLFDTFINGNFFDIFKPLEDSWNMPISGFPNGDEFIDSEGNLVIELALAGYSKDQLSIAVDRDVLSISAKKSSSTDGSNVGRKLSRRSFKRQFCDPTNQWDIEDANANYENGLLRVKIPPTKSKKSQSKTIEIR